MALPKPIAAHPPALIDLVVDVLFDKNKTIIGLIPRPMK
jgi:hypothetical protein